MKKILAIIVVLSIFMSGFAYADSSYFELKEDLSENNTTLDILDLNVKNMKIEVYKAKISALNMESQLDALKALPFPISSSVTSGMRYVIEIVPQQVGYGLFALENNLDITKNTLNSAMRQMATGVISMEDTYNLNKEKFEFYKSEYEHSKLQYDLGRLSQTELLVSEVKYLESKTAMVTSERDLEDMFHSLNNFIGYDLSKRYVIQREKKMDVDLGTAESLVEKAFKYRFEIKDFEKQIELQENIINFYNYGDYLAFYSNYKAMKDAEIEKERLTLQLELKKKEITEEIYSAVSANEILEMQIAQLENTLEMQKNDLEKLRAQAEQGYMTEATFKELEFAVTMIENNLDVMYYTYNSNLYKLYDASQIGPAYGGGK